MADKSFKQITNGPKPFTKEESDQILRNHTVYLQACVNYIGRWVGWRKYVRLAFATTLTIGAFREEVVALYFYLRTLVF